MRLLVLEPRPEFGGGMEGVSLRLSKELARRGDEIVLVHDKDGDMLPAYRQFCANIVRTELTGFRKKEPLRTLRLIRRLDRIIREHQIDACYTSHLGYLTIGSVLRLINSRAWHYHLGLLGTGRGMADRWSLRHTGSGISPAPHTLQTWRAIGWPKQSLHEVRNWVDVDDFYPADDRPALRRSLGIPKEAFCIGFVGRLVKEKGVEVLIDAFNDLKTENAFLVMVGPGEQQFVDALRARCKRTEQLLIMPRTSRPRDIYAAVDVACVPSIGADTFPLVVLEAMATGTPVICSDVGILPKVLGDEFAELVVAQGSVDGLLDRFVHVSYALEHYRATQAALRHRALSQYGPEEPVDAYRRIIQATMAQKPKRG